MSLGIRCGNVRRRRLADAIGIQEIAGDIDNFLAAPFHDEMTGIGHIRDMYAFEIFASRGGFKCSDVFRIKHHSHALLRFRERNFRTI